MCAVFRILTTHMHTHIYHPLNVDSLRVEKHPAIFRCTGCNYWSNRNFKQVIDGRFIHLIKLGAEGKGKRLRSLNGLEGEKASQMK